jgi:hypothetical protein
VLAIAEDPVNRELLFVGTEFGLYFSLDAGGHWTQLKGGMPTISVRDLSIQKREGDLVAATFGRGFYILDDITPLRNSNASALQQKSTIFPVRDPLMYVQQTPLGGRRGHFGAGYYSADNPPYGAVVTYYLKEKFKTKKEQRQEREKAAAAPAKEGDVDNPKGKREQAQNPRNASVNYPSMDELRAEAEEEAPSVYLVVSDANGNPVRRVKATNETGMNRAAWDLRMPPAELHTPNPEEADFEEFFQAPQGPLVMPGEYSVALAARVDGKDQQLAGPVRFKVNALGTDQMNEQDRAALQQFQQKLARLDRALTGAIETGNDVGKHLTSIHESLRETSGNVAPLVAQADDLQNRLREIMRALRGDVALRRRQENTPASINDRVNQIEDEERLSTVRPTQTHIASYNIAAQQFSDQLSKLRQLVDVDLKKLQDAMEKAGAPWTPGHVPEWAPE